MKPESGSNDDFEALVREIAAGERRMHDLPDSLSAGQAAETRRRALELRAGTSLANIGRYSLDPEAAASRHCENFIGAAQVPMGIIGPLTISGDHVNDSLYVPLATTEGALLASVNRGCRAIRHAGGAVVHIEEVGMTRAPVFRTSGYRQTREFLRWVRDHEDEIRTAAEATSRHLSLREIRPSSFGTTVFLRFRFDSGDAMGMNMATIACDRVVRDLIEPATGISCIALSGNYCTDKKPAAINFHEGRGKRIYSEVTLSDEVLESCLRTNAKDLVEVQYRKNLLGSIAAGSSGFNAHYANVLGAFFLATGQDVAHVVGGSMGVTCIEARDGDGVMASVFLPDVPLGAVGGGTSLETQREALDLLGAVPDSERPGHATMRLAEILGATVLAGELSLLAAFTSSDLSSAHERLARGVSAIREMGPES